MKRVAIALFGGSGERFGSSEPKQFIMLGDAPMMVVTLRGLSACPEVDEIYVAAKPDTMEKTHQLISEYHIRKVKAIIPGGKSREESVYAALAYLNRVRLDFDDLVLIQDGDRPNVDPEIVKENYETAFHYEAAVTALPATDSIIYSELGLEVNSYKARPTIYYAQTPQTFRFGLILRCFDHVRRHKKLDMFTDDGSLVKSCGHKVKIVPGKKSNVKITTKLDLAMYFEGRLHL
ncbi:MAG: IspD/TarI family cytidylyltransferase [Candidatus Enteromonas sp.]|nr:IspD/TarI family cytidylyltransferase [Candidatus Enteromonas sp.]